MKNSKPHEETDYNKYLKLNNNFKLLTKQWDLQEVLREKFVVLCAFIRIINKVNEPHCQSRSKKRSNKTKSKMKKANQDIRDELNGKENQNKGQQMQERSQK